MTFRDKLNQISEFQEAINKHGKLDSEVLKKINYKFRLEWNFHSNKLEGNSLTKMETRTVMVGNITIEGKPIKDVYEMHQHDEIISEILRIGKGELNLSEARIKDIHRALMHEEDPEKKALIGKWKTVSNYIHNYKNERFNFVPPHDVPERMHELINWLNNEKGKIERQAPGALHPAELAFEFHLRYIEIHPFYDGNGRTARIFTNLILISYGYPPLYVKVAERDIYYQFLADIQGYGGKPDLFYSFMSDLLIRSQRIVIDAIEGKNIDEPDDLDKRLLVFESEMKYGDNSDDIKDELNRKVFYKIFDSWISGLLETTISVLQKFNKYFASVDHHINVGGGVTTVTRFSIQSPAEVIESVLSDIKRAEQYLEESGIKVQIMAEYNNFKNGGVKTFDGRYEIAIRLLPAHYELYIDEFRVTDGSLSKAKIFERGLHQPVTKAEIDQIARKFGDTILSDIEAKTKKLGLRP